MNRTSICILACMLTLATASPAALATPQGLPQVAEQPAAQDPHRELLQALASAAARKHRAHRAPRRASHVKAHKDGRRDDARPARIPQHSTSEGKHGRVAAGAIQKTLAHEAAERDARAENLYRSSQLSAPIIKDAKACKRIGARGESIYENC